ncbi:sensor histidine kinase [Phytohabitans aurantiacus]|uniref:sensor histidine kinase n=1 Tax=Phytohabitans aurantiacus TaxID=3016789 RepID=UPI002492DBD3|nr:nitrate- and nitrite sensing domain-containing protein [Phytohabitans aurantiacus]
MNTGNWSIRAKIIALVAVPLAALVALWIFTTTLTVGPALHLLDTRALRDQLSRPGDALVSELQRERRLSVVYLAGRAQELPALDEQRSRTDAAVTDFRERARGEDVRDAADEAVRARVEQVTTALELLPAGRGFVDRREMDKAGALGLYTGMIDEALRLFDALANLDDDALDREARATVALTRAREVLGQEDALLAGAFAAKRFESGEHSQLVQIIGTERYLHVGAVSALSEQDRLAHQRMVEGEAFERLKELEDRIMAQGRDNAAVPINANAWQSAYEPVVRQLRDFELGISDDLTDRATPVAAGVLLRLALAGLFGLAAIALSLLLCLRVGRSLIRRLSGLRQSAFDLADRRLPEVVARLRRGEDVDVAAEAPPLEYGTDEIGQLGHAFTEAQRTAVQAAVDESTMRRGLNEVFLNIARRSQTLLHRQLTLLDGMERRTTEPDELEELFRIDHLATRMRRHAEDLAILAGAVPGRGWRNPVSMLDVIRGAVSEVEDYARVAVNGVESAAVAGRAVGDMIHLLAELIENATSFSPPTTRVQVSGAPVPNGYAIEIEDRGLGMKSEELEEANRRLARPPEFDPANSARLGLFVVAQLGARHGVKIRLRSSPFGGVTAVVLVPPDLVLPEPEPAALLAAPADDVPRRRVRVVTRVESAPAIESAPTPSAATALGGAATLRAVRSSDSGVRAVEGDVPAGRPAPDGMPASTVAPPLHTDGLPRRVRQASLAPQLREQPTGDLPEDPAPAPRTADQARAAMAALQAGTARGRREADGAPAARGTAPVPGVTPEGE